MGSMKDFEGVDREKTSGGKFALGMLFGLLAGGAVGASLALLFAPKSGEELREDLAELTNMYADKTSDSVGDASEKARQIVNDGRRRADVIIDDARQRASTLLTDAEKIVQDARKRAKSAAGKSAAEVREKADNLAEAARAGVEAFRDELQDDPTPSGRAKKQGKA